MTNGAGKKKIDWPNAVTGAIVGGLISLIPGYYLGKHFAETAITDARDAGVLQERKRCIEHARKGVTEEIVERRAKAKCGADRESLKGEITALKAEKNALTEKHRTAQEAKDAEYKLKLAAKDREIDRLKSTEGARLLVDSFDVAYSRLIKAAATVNALSKQSNPGAQAVQNASYEVASALGTFENLREIYAEMIRAANDEMAGLLADLRSNLEGQPPKITIYELNGRLRPLIEGRKARELLLREQIQKLEDIVAAVQVREE